MSTKDNREGVLSVSSSTGTKPLGKSIYSVFSKEGKSSCVLRAIGAGAISQSIKGVIIANNYLSSRGKKAVITPWFKDIGEDLTAVEMKVEFVDV